MPTAVVLAADTPWPLVTAAVVVAVALCLWGLFRRGSIADRARDEERSDLGDGDEITPPPR